MENVMASCRGFNSDFNVRSFTLLVSVVRSFPYMPHATFHCPQQSAINKVVCEHCYAHVHTHSDRHTYMHTQMNTQAHAL